MTSQFREWLIEELLKTKKCSYIVRENANFPNLQLAAMQIGKWPHFRILGSGLTLLAQERQGFLGLQVETFKENLLNSKL